MSYDKGLKPHNSQNKEIIELVYNAKPNPATLYHVFLFS